MRCVVSTNLSFVSAFGASSGLTMLVCLSALFTSSCFLTCSTSVRSSFAILTESSRQSGFVVWKVGSLITIGYRHSACHTLLFFEHDETNERQVCDRRGVARDRNSA